MEDITVRISTEIIPENYTSPEVSITFRFKESDRYKAEMLISNIRNLEGWNIEIDGGRP